MPEVRDLMSDIVSKSIEELMKLLSKLKIRVENNQIGGKIETKLHEADEEYPKRVLGKARSDSKENALKAAIYEAWAVDNNDIRSRLLAIV